MGSNNRWGVAQGKTNPDPRISNRIRYLPLQFTQQGGHCFGGKIKDLSSSFKHFAFFHTYGGISTVLFRM